MKLNFTNISNEKATMLIYKHIGYDETMGYGVDGNMFASEMLYLNEAYPDLKEISVRINSVGGDVSEGFSICSAILNSSIPVVTYIDGMAYSMAGVIAMCGTKRKMSDFGTFMMHSAQGGANQSILDLITNSLAKIFERCTNLSLDKCKELMDKETWMSPEECLNFGLIDEIVKTENKKPLLKNVAELHAFYNKVLINQNKKMLKLTNLLKLNNEASEDAIVEKVEAIVADKENALSENETLKAQNAELAAKLKAFEDAELEKENAAKLAEIENAIKDGKVAEDSKEQWVNSPLKSNELKNLFGSLKTTPVHVNIIDKLDNNGGNERAAWTFADWEKKDPKGLLEMQKNDAPAFENLVKSIELGIKSKK